MVTKYNTGDKVLIEATIKKAFQSGDKILYDIAECDTPILEKQIKNHTAYIDIKLKKDAIEALATEINELNDILERARSIMDDLAQRDVSVDVHLGKVIAETPHEPDGHSEDKEIRLNELKNVLHTEDK